MNTLETRTMEQLLSLLEHECILSYMLRETDWPTTVEACAAIYEMWPPQ